MPGGSKGRKPVTSADVAREVGVSRATVSYLLNNTPGQTISDETRRRVMEAAERLGYTPNQSARALRLGRSDIVLFPLGDVALSHAFAGAINVCSAALNLQGFTLVPDAAMYPSPEHAADAWLRLGPAALIDLILPADHTGVLRMSRAGVARVTADIEVPGHLSAMDIIGVDARKCQLSHVIERGATNIVYAAPPSYDESSMSPLLRPVLEAVASDASVRLAFDTVEATPESARAAARRWADAGVDAVCGHSDDYALPILTALIDLGVEVPGAMLVIGVGDIPASRATTPSLSSVTAEMEQLGESLAASVQTAVLDPTTPVRYPAPEPVVMERDSSNRPC
ncbi:MAG: LacI family transcriptional regulator [Acidimicrobiaceae bacterium]|nr:LacI family transcriptional regulator [Acidimicrobiaceae bacterium]MYG99424.1 LacI family transcriptional regulator [Acidimicrobiaceae bacterium]MYL02586.1 LacI family transcriptional regulator [Acidimicrobiaceae bacterium]